MTQHHTFRLVALTLAIALGFAVQAGSHDQMIELATHAVKLTYCPV